MTEKQYRITSTLAVLDGNHRDIVDVIAQEVAGGPVLPDDAVTDFHRKDRRATELRWGHGSERLGRILTLWESPPGELHFRIYFNVGSHAQARMEAMLAGEPMTAALTYRHTQHQGTRAQVWRFPVLAIYPTPPGDEGDSDD